MKVAISQSNYIPWRGYFDMIASVDVFVLYDEVQYTRRDWRNRNKIKAPHGLQWLTVPVETKGSYHQKISDVQVSEHSWSENHWKAIRLAYGRAPFWSEQEGWLESLFSGVQSDKLVDINRHFLDGILSFLNIETQIVRSSDLPGPGGQNERLLGLCSELGATHYLSGPAAATYLDTSLFAANGVQVEWMDYSSYPTYTQMWGDFVGEVSVLDLILNVGTHAQSLIRRTGE